VIAWSSALGFAEPLAGDPASPPGKALLVAVIVVGLLAAAAWALRRKAETRRAGRSVTIETAVSLGERRSLVIVAVEGRRLLLGLGPGHIGLVTELAPAAGASFGDALDASLSPRSRT